MFALNTVYWILSVVFTFLQVDSWNNVVTACYGSDNAFLCIVREVDASRTPAAAWLLFFTNILLVNYIIADGIIVWRAWVLCSDQSRVVLMIPVVMLAINTVAYLVTFAGRVIQFVSKDPQKFLVTSLMANIAQVVPLTLSLFINIFATSIIAVKAWKYRKLLMESGIGIRTPSQAIKILALLVESGMIYILIGVTSVVSVFALIRSGNFPGLLILVGIQLVGIYPIVVVLLVEKNRSLNSTHHLFGTIMDIGANRPSQVEPMTFASGPVLASGDAQMGAGKGKDSSEEYSVA